MKRLFATLPRRLIGLVALVALPFLGYVAWLHWQARQEAMAEMRATLDRLMQAMLTHERHAIEQTHELLRIMAHADETLNLASSECSQLARRLLETQTLYLNFAAVDARGQVVCSAIPPARPISVADRHWFLDALGSGHLSREYVHQSRIVGSPGVVFGLPIAQRTGEAGVVYALAGRDWFSRLVEDVQLPPGWSATVLDRQGRVLARQPEGARWSGRRLVEVDALLARVDGGRQVLSEFTGIDDVARLHLAASTRSAPGALFLSVGAPRADTLERIDARFRDQMLILLGLTLLALAVAWWGILRAFLGWTADTLAATWRYGEGEWSARLRPDSGIRELDAIAAAFNGMAGNLEELEVRRRRLTDLYATLSQVNQAIVRLRHPESLFREVCEAAMGFPGFGLAWVGTWDGDELKLAARSGSVDPALAEGLVQAHRHHASCPAPSCPLERLARQGGHFVCNDLAADQELALPRADLLAAGLPSWALFALRCQGRVVGIFSVHARQPGFFDSEVMRLLDEMAMDISFALDNLASQEERLRSEAELRLTSQVFEASGEGICITDADRRILTVNPAFCRMTGYGPSDVVGQRPGLLRSDVQGPDFYSNMWATLAETDQWQGEIINRRKDGTLFPVWLSISAARDPEGRLSHYIGIFLDISERKAADARLRHLAQHDALTDLPNRELFNDRLEQAVLTARRYERAVALLLLDINRLRPVNETDGHRAGDAALLALVQRLAAHARPGDTLARLSGTEFALILANLGHDSDIIPLAQAILALVTHPLNLGGKEIILGVRIGISLYPKDADGAAALLRNADVALARAKAAGPDSIRFYSSGMDAEASRRVLLEGHLRHALSHHELQVHYQPQLKLQGGRVIGTEALLRWNSPQLGAVSPVEFIPVAEDSGLIIPIGAWVLRQACAQGKAWLDAGLPPLLMAVNLSVRQFRQPDLVETVAAILADTGFPAGSLELELTESAFLGDAEGAGQTLRRIKELGVKLSIDDFGTGYSSLAYLSRFHFDKIKIDQSFVRDITENPANAAIATATIALARSLNLSVLAEGVETEAQAAFLRARGCDAMQGYLFSRPLPPDELARLVREGHALPGAPAGEPHARTLLLVDDEPNILKSLQRLFRHEDFRVLTATSPREAFDILAREPVRVIVSDQRMPEMNGTEFLSRVKQLYPDTLRIVLSGYTDADSVADAINRGSVYKFLTKPWDDDVLREHIRESFRIAEALHAAGQSPSGEAPPSAAPESPDRPGR